MFLGCQDEASDSLEAGVCGLEFWLVVKGGLVETSSFNKQTLERGEGVEEEEGGGERMGGNGGREGSNGRSERERDRTLT